MRFARAAITAATLLFFGAIGTAYGQPDHKDDKHKDDKQDKPQKQADKHEKSPPPGPQKHSPIGSVQQHKEQPTEHAQPVAPAAARQPAQPSHQQDRQTRTREQAKPSQPTEQHPDQQRAQQPTQQQEQSRTRAQALAWQKNNGWLGKGGGWQPQHTWQQTRAQRWGNEHRTWVQRGGYGGSYIPQDQFARSFGDQHQFRINARPSIVMGYPRFEYSGFSFLLVDPWPEYWAENWYDMYDLYIDYDHGYYLHNVKYPQVRLAIAVAL